MKDIFIVMLYIVGFALLISEPTDNTDFTVSHNIVGIFIITITFCLTYKNKK